MLSPHQRLLLSLCIIILAVFAALLRPYFELVLVSSSPSKPTWNSSQLLSPVYSLEQVQSNNGKDGNPSWLVILGEVYNVTGGKPYMGESGYRVFVAQDATSAFSTGEFKGSNRSLDDVSHLTPTQMLAIAKWVDFYRTHKQYAFLGVLHGRYYSAEGKRTKAWEKARISIDQGKAKQGDLDALTKRFPTCSSSWRDGQGHEVKCESVGVPRILVLEDSQRCACVDDKKHDVAGLELHVYPDCQPESKMCKFPGPVPDYRQPPKAVLNQ